MSDDFSGHLESLDAPADDAASVTPSDGTALSKTTRGLYVGGAGDVSVNMASSGSAVTFSSVPAGSILPIRVTHVRSTSTTATNIVALW